jgi:ribonuclease VapC
LQVIDSSAVVAILLGEPEAAAYTEAMGRGGCHMSLANVYEAEVVLLNRRGPNGPARVRRLLAAAGATLHEFDDAQARLATAAYERFGKGRHPAQLNLMDCAAYALARSLDAPLLYKGEDFSRTDVVSALTAG